MPMATWPLSLPSRLPSFFSSTLFSFTHSNHRQNPAVVSQADKVFLYVAQALEAEMLGSGEVAQKVVGATKALVQASNVNAQAILQEFSPEAQQIISRYFA